MSASRIGAAFERARRDARAALIPFVVAGDPDVETSREILAALGEAGADLVELGVPYSDPLADGPSIVAAGVRALDAGTTIPHVLALVRSSPVPAVLFSYANPLIQYGIERLAQELADAGGCGAIIPDLPLEETRRFAEIFARHGLELPLLIAPTTPPERAKRIVAESRGFVYLVARLGVTGAGKDLAIERLEAQIGELRRLTTLPIAVGFGISTPAHVEAVAALADGVIVGSALVDVIAAAPSPAAAARDFVRSLVAATPKGERAA